MPQNAPWPDDNIILYDGACALCSGWIRFVARRDHERQFRFTPIESPYGSALARFLGIDPHEPDTNAVIIDGRALRRSDAALAVLAALPNWRWVILFRIVPGSLRDTLYTLIAKNRYLCFGRNEFCDLGGDQLAGRIVTDKSTRKDAL